MSVSLEIVERLWVSATSGDSGSAEGWEPRLWRSDATDDGRSWEFAPSWQSACICPGLCLRDHQLD